MPLISQGAIIQITIDGRLYGQRTMTVLHYRLTAFSPDTELEDLYPAIINAMFGTGTDFEDIYLNCCSSSFILSRILVQVIYPIRYYAKELNQSGKVGAVGSIALPPGVSVSLTKRSILSTRHSIGGVRMPGVPTTFTSAGELTTTGRTAYGIFCDNLKTVWSVLTLVGLEPIIFRRAQPGLSELVSYAFPQNTIRTMSRRVVQRGE